MNLLYDRNDLPHANKLGDARFDWLQDLGAIELHKANHNESGFLFGYQQGIEHLRQQVSDRPHVHDRPEEREELVRLDHVLQRLQDARVEVPTPKTWVLRIDEELPPDLDFPLFVRTPTTSWKRGGGQARVNNRRQLDDEMEMLRRVFGWDMPILARQWLDLAVAGQWMFGDAPQEIRVWIVDRVPTAWSFHYLHAVRNPIGFPPSNEDLALVAEWAARIASPHQSRLIAADFVKDRKGQWHFLEAGPGAAAGAAHEAVIKFVARRLADESDGWPGDRVGGPF